MNYPTHTLVIEVRATHTDTDTLQRFVKEALHNHGGIPPGFEVSIDKRPTPEVYTVNVIERRDGLYVFQRLQDRDLFAAVFERDEVIVGAEPLFGPEAMGDLIAAEEG